MDFSRPQRRRSRTFAGSERTRLWLRRRTCGADRPNHNLLPWNSSQSDPRPPTGSIRSGRALGSGGKAVGVIPDPEASAPLSRDRC